eukprot:2987050-Rhodomonas_salina.1
MCSSTVVVDRCNSTADSTDIVSMAYADADSTPVSTYIAAIAAAHCSRAATASSPDTRGQYRTSHGIRNLSTAHRL